MKDKLILSILSVVAISVFTFGATYAYYTASVTESIEGEAQGGIKTTLLLNTVHNATRLVPLKDNLVSTAISKASNKCVDKNNYQVCSLYKITLTNEEDNEILYGYVRTETSTYTTDNLKYQIFDSNYNALTDIMSLSSVSGTPVYFKKNSADYSVSSTGTSTYYLAIWLKDIGKEQSEDYSKNFSGYIGFESVNSFGVETGKIEAGFEV